MDAKRRELIRDTYDRVASEYAAHLADELAGKPLDRALLDRFAAATRGAGPVCDLGCGPGQVAAYLHGGGVDVRGVDLSPAMVEQARRLHPGITFEIGDMFALDAAETTYAGVVAFYAIVHVAREALDAAFREVRRVLSPGGVLLLAFHVGDESLRPGELWGVPVTLDWVFFRTGEVVEALRAAGLRVTEVVEREPYEGAEHASRRAYVFATRESEHADAGVPRP